MPLRRRFVSVGWKLAGSTVAVVAVLAVATHVVVSNKERQSLMTSKQAGADMLIELSAAGLSAPLAFGDDQGVQEQVNLLAANEDVVYAAAWSVSMEAPDRIGARLGELRRDAITIEAPDHIPRSIERRQGDLSIERAPVLDPSRKTVGVVAIGFSLEKERAALATRQRWSLLLSAAAATLLASLLLLIARRSIVKPLRALMDAARRLERGESAVIEVAANDEIGRLTTALKSMSEAIREREQSLNDRNRDMRLILDNAGEGFLTVLADGTLSEERSRMLEEWFPLAPGASAAGNAFDYLEAIAGKETAEWVRLGWESLSEGFLPIEVTIEQLPKKFENRGRFFAVEYRPITDSRDPDRLEAVLIVVRDTTAEVERRRSEEMQKEALALFQHFLKDRTGFGEFFKECRALVESIRPRESDQRVVFRNIHTLKGNAGLLGLESVSRFCHELESRLSDEEGGPTTTDIATLESLWRRIEETVGRLGADAGPRYAIEPEEHRALLDAIRAGAPASQLEAMVVALAYEPASRRLAQIGEQVRALGERVGKPEIQVIVKPTPLRLPPRRWATFWPVLAHILRNAVDHGLETPDERARLGKTGNGNITLALEAVGPDIVFSFGDDGRGIAWDTLTAKAALLGMDTASQEALEEILFSGSVSSRDEVTELSGRGVGMSAVRDAVESLGGRISIASAAGEGTTLRFSFPVTMLKEDAA